MTYDEAKAEILASAKRAGVDINTITKRQLDDCIAQLIDTQRNSAWASIKWFPMNACLTIYVWFVKALTRIINFANGK